MPRGLWIGGKAQAPLYVTDPEPRRPDLVVWIDSVSGRIVACEVADPAESTGALVSSLSGAISGSRFKSPDRIRVADASLAEAIRSAVGEGMRIEIAPTPELARVVEDLSGFLGSMEPASDGGESPSYLEAGRVSVALVARLFDVAADLYRLRPWSRLWDADTIGLDVVAYDVKGAVLSVIGRAGENFGFVVFESASAYDAFGAAGADPLRRRHDLGASTLSLNFDAKSRISPTMRREISRHGWKVAGPKAYPYVMAVDRDGVHRPLGERDVLLVCAVGEGLARFVSRHGSDLSPRMRAPISEEYRIGEPEQVAVRLTAPHPEMPWLPDTPAFEEQAEGERDALYLDQGGEDRALHDRRPGEDEEAASSEIDRIVNAFIDDQRDAGRPARWLESARLLAWALLEYQVDFTGGPPGRLMERHAEEFLLGYFPRKVSADEELIERAPDALVALYKWLARRGAISDDVAVLVRDRILAIHGRFLAAARDPSRFGPAKEFTMAMKADGIDIGDEKAVRAYAARYNGRPGTGGAPPTVTAGEAPLEAGPRLSPRWVPATGTCPPGAKETCPCGSGRAYGKCCMRR